MNKLIKLIELNGMIVVPGLYEVFEVTFRSGRDFGFAMNDTRRVHFSIRGGYRTVANEDKVVLGPDGLGELPEEGRIIYAKVVLIEGEGYHATEWGLVQEYDTAKNIVAGVREKKILDERRVKEGLAKRDGDTSRHKPAPMVNMKRIRESGRRPRMQGQQLATV